MKDGFIEDRGSVTESGTARAPEGFTNFAESISAESLEALLDVLPGMGYAYEDVPVFLENVAEFLKSHLKCERAALVLSESYGSTVAGDSIANRGEEEPEEGRSGRKEGKAGQPPLPLELLLRHGPASGRVSDLKEVCLQINEICARRSRQEDVSLISHADLEAPALFSHARSLEKLGFSFIYPILFQSDIIGLLLLSSPQQEERGAYDHRDRIFLEIGSALLALTLRNAAIRMENSRLRLNQGRPASAEAAESGATDSDEPEEPSLSLLEAGGRSFLVADPGLQESLKNWSRLAIVDVPVLIRGETGTGKELFARWIHEQSHCSGPFVPVNCASVPDTLWESELFGNVRGAFTDARQNRKGLVELAADGVLFFDEIGDMPLDMQGKLLRLIQEKRYRPLGSGQEKQAGCRFLFATHRDLQKNVQQGSFRQDLFYRISVLVQTIPSLRDRPRDIVPLMQYFLTHFCRKYRIDPARIDAGIHPTLLEYSWPGNVRELESVSLRLALEYSGQTVRQKDLMATILGTPVASSRPESQPEEGEMVGAFLQGFQNRASSDLGLASGITLDYDHLIQRYSRDILKEALERSEGNRSRAAALLGISRGRFNYQWKQLLRRG